MELLIFAALAAVVLFQLYSVLGRRVGRQPEEARETEGPRPLLKRGSARVEEAKPAPEMAALAQLRAKDSGFDLSRFLEGARAAYEMVVKAYASGDRAALKGLTTAAVFQAFEAGLNAREAADRTEKVEFLVPPRADLDEATVAGETARLKVRFLAELRTRTKDAAGEAVDDRRTAELWTFERPVASRDPNWLLARVEAAQA